MLLESDRAGSGDARPAWTDKDLGATPRGGTGFGVRTLTELALQWPDRGIR